MGIAGLTTAAILAKNGMNVTGIERRKKTGGLISTFDRKGIPFINLSGSAIMGCAEGEFIHEVLCYLDVRDAVEFIPLDPAGKYFFPDGAFVESADSETARRQLLDEFPEEREALRQYFKLAESLYRESMGLALHDMKASEMMLFPLKCPNLMRYGAKTVGEVMKSLFKDERLIAHLLAPTTTFIPGDLFDASFTTMAIISTMHSRFDINLVKGGTYNFAKALADSVKNHGGTILTDACVSKITAEDGRATGVELESGGVMSADYVVSCVDGYQTFRHFLDPSVVPKKVREKINAMKPGPSMTVVYLGLEGLTEEAGIISGANAYLPSYDPTTWRRANGEETLDDTEGAFTLINLGGGKTTAWMKGVSQVIIMKPLLTMPDRDLASHKEALIEHYVSNLEKILPNVRSMITMSDCFTSQDFEHELHLPTGSIGWAVTPDQVGQNTIQQKTFLKNLYLAGQWTAPGPGINTCILSGMDAGRQILRDAGNTMAARTIEEYRDLLL